MLLVAALSQLRRARPPTPRRLRAIDIAVFVFSSAAIALMCLELRGIGSLYGIAIVTLLVARNSYMYDRWTRALAPVGLSVAIYPAILLVAVIFVPRIRAQLHDERAVAMLVTNMVAILSTAVACVAGGDTIWRLRQQVFASRTLGKYRLERPIGAGGMGEVWAARHSTLRREVAVNILRTRDPACPRWRPFA